MKFKLRSTMQAAAIVFLLSVSSVHAQDAQPGNFTIYRFGSDTQLLGPWHAPYTGTGEFASIKDRKNPGLAVLYSLVLPGMGELYAGNFSTGKYLLGTELSLWLSLYGLHSYGSWLRSDARSFAATYAGVDPSGKDDKFFVNVANFTSRNLYNEKKLRDRDPAAVYTDPTFDWDWQSDDLRQEYRTLRVRSDQMLNAVRFAAVAIIANHVISAIIAGTSASRYNEQLERSGPLGSLSFGLIPLPDGFMAGIQHSF